MEFRCAIQTVTPSMGAWGRAMQSPKAEAAALGRRGCHATPGLID